jgi:hypothetical protein
MDVIEERIEIKRDNNSCKLIAKSTPLNKLKMKYYNNNI